MPPKKCGACQKMVYPMDELKCLDKTWHKACFRCQVCSMTLNMKTYKGYNKLPYCNAHYPTTKFTAVADTPENMRIKMNTAIQSNIKYHEEFEAAKGQYTAVAEDPETARVKKNMTTISNVAYHGDLARKQEMENARPAEIDASDRRASAPMPRVRQPGSVSDYDPAGESQQANKKPQSPAYYGSSNSQRSATTSNHVLSSQPPAQSQPAPQFTQPAPVAAPRLASPVRSAPAPTMSPPPVRDPSPVRQPSPPPVRDPSPVRQPSPPPVRDPSPPPVIDPSPDNLAGAQTSGTETDKGHVSKALYDYIAADDDEVGFEENDIIINCEAIDDGWMYGTVERTGLRGMLPSNYVDKLNW